MLWCGACAEFRHCLYLGRCSARPGVRPQTSQRLAGLLTKRLCVHTQLPLPNCRRNEVLARVYMARSDDAFMVRAAGLHVWKTIVTNTPKTLGELLPALMEQLIGGWEGPCWGWGGKQDTRAYAQTRGGAFDTDLPWLGVVAARCAAEPGQERHPGAADVAGP